MHSLRMKRLALIHCGRRGERRLQCAVFGIPDFHSAIERAGGKPAGFRMETEGEDRRVVPRVGANKFTICDVVLPDQLVG